MWGIEIILISFLGRRNSYRCLALWSSILNWYRWFLAQFWEDPSTGVSEAKLQNAHWQRPMQSPPQLVLLGRKRCFEIRKKFPFGQVQILGSLQRRKMRTRSSDCFHGPRLSYGRFRRLLFANKRRNAFLERNERHSLRSEKSSDVNSRKSWDG